MQIAIRRHAAPLLAAALTFVAACGGGDKGTGGTAGVATKLAFSGQPVSAPTDFPLGTVVVDIRDANGSLVNGATDNVTLTLSANPGGGTLNGTLSTAAVAGRATFTNLSINAAGNGYRLAASAPGLTGITSNTFNVTATGSVAASIVKVAGDGSGTSGQQVATKPRVKVTDASGLPVPGVGVTFAVTGGNGYATGTMQVTDATGHATVGSWMLGTAGANTMAANVTGISSASFTVNAAAPTSNYNIDLRYVGTAPAASIQTAFSQAVARWQQIITGDIPNINTDTFARGGSCGEPNFPDTRYTAIDDVIIYAEIKPIDGAGQVLGAATPCFSVQGKTVIGYMKFDSADLDQMVSSGTLNEVIVHEMGHVIGLGTLWEDFLSRAQTSADTSWIKTTDVRWTGSNGNSWHTATGGTGSAPIENCASGVAAGCGSGTWLSHWRESTYRNELMTGYISATGNPISRITIGALKDMGYVVNLGVADVYSIPVASASFSGRVPEGIPLNEERYTGPIIELDPQGRFVRRVQ